jgi:hypothetical protein
MHVPKVMPNPLPPAPSPTSLDPQILAARQAERRRQESMYGRQSTILTGASGVGPSTLGSPTLLGA